MTGISRMAPIMTLKLNVNPNASNSRKPGSRRSAPSAKPMYQSGWEPAVTGDGS